MTLAQAQPIWTRFQSNWQRVRERNINPFSLLWAAFWMRFAGLSPLGRLANGIAAWFTPPHKFRHCLALLNSNGYIAFTAAIRHANVTLGKNVFIDERVVIYQAHKGGSVKLSDNVSLGRDTIVEIGPGGSLSVGAGTYIQARCQLVSYEAPIHIGSGVNIAANCAFYPYDHGMIPDQPIGQQPLQTKGGIFIEDDAWLGVGVTVLSGVRIGKGAVVGAGAVVSRDIPDGAIAVGVPARVVKMRGELGKEKGCSLKVAA